LNNKFVAASENLKKLLATRIDQIESKFSKLLGNDMHASNSSSKKKICGNTGDDISNLHIPKFPLPPKLSLKNVHSQTIIGNSVEGGNFVPPYQVSTYSTQPPQAPASHRVICIIVLLIIHCDIHMSLMGPHIPGS
jgi:hypothetical protein